MSGDKTQPLDPMRQEFETWMIEDAGESASRRPNMLDRIHDEYAFEPASTRWRIWQAAWNRCAPTLDPQGLPPAGLREAKKFEPGKFSNPTGYRIVTGHENWCEIVFGKPCTCVAAERERGGEG